MFSSIVLWLKEETGAWKVGEKAAWVKDEDVERFIFCVFVLI